MVSKMGLKAVGADSAEEQAPCSGVPTEGRRSSVHAGAHREIYLQVAGRKGDGAAGSIQAWEADQAILHQQGES